MDKQGATVVEAAEGWIKIYQYVLMLKLWVKIVIACFLFAPFMSMMVTGIQMTEPSEMRAFSNEAIALGEKTASLEPAYKWTAFENLENRYDSYIERRNAENPLSFGTKVLAVLAVIAMLILYVFFISLGRFYNIWYGVVYVLWCIYSCLSMYYQSFSVGADFNKYTSIAMFSYNTWYYSTFIVHPIMFALMCFWVVKAFMYELSLKPKTDEE